MVGLGGRQLLAAARELGPPVTPEWIADTRAKYGDQVADPFADCRAHWLAAIDARDPIQVLRAERELSRLFFFLASAFAQVSNTDTTEVT
jgi:hypothetical protein